MYLVDAHPPLRKQGLALLACLLSKVRRCWGVFTFFSPFVVFGIAATILHFASNKPANRQLSSNWPGNCIPGAAPPPAAQAGPGAPGPPALQGALTHHARGLRGAHHHQGLTLTVCGLHPSSGALVDDSPNNSFGCKTSHQKCMCAYMDQAFA